MNSRKGDGEDEGEKGGEKMMFFFVTTDVVYFEIMKINRFGTLLSLMFIFLCSYVVLIFFPSPATTWHSPRL